MKALILIMLIPISYWISIGFKPKPIIRNMGYPTTYPTPLEEEVYAGREEEKKGEAWFTRSEWRALDRDVKEAYVNTFIKFFSQAAKEESKRSGIPWQIYVSQAILESNYAKSRLAVEGQNLFGVKYWGDDKNKYIVVADDKPNDRFRKFANQHQSLIFQSKILNDRYRHRIKGKPTLDKWVDCLCGGRTIEESKRFVESGGYVYATSCYKGKKSYAQKLLKIINRL